MPDYTDLKFWIAVLGAAFLKVMTSQWHSFKRACLVVITAVFCAWAFTDPMVDWLNLDPLKYRNAVAAVLAITGESGMRWLINITPDRLIDVWRGRK